MNEKLHLLFPRELLWLVFIPFIIIFFIQKYNPIQVINEAIFAFLSAYTIIIIYQTTKLIKKTIFKKLNIVFTWLISGIDAILNYKIIQSGSVNENSNFLFVQIINDQSLFWNILLVFLFKVSVMTIVFICLERAIYNNARFCQGDTFGELCAYPKIIDKNIALYHYARSLFFVKDEKRFFIAEPNILQVYYYVFYKPLFIVIVMMIFVFFNNLYFFFSKMKVATSVSLYIFAALLMSVVILPVIYFLQLSRRSKNIG
ncbi:MAG: hypothetical protein LDL24_06930 [Treponema sp.]|nr:hypothetical protein [Treponema sp.]